METTTVKKSAANILERNLIAIHQKAVSPYDYRRSIAKRSYFDSVDVLMHIASGYMSVADGTQVYHLKNLWPMAARIYDDFFLKKVTLEGSITAARAQGAFLASGMELPFAPHK